MKMLLVIAAILTTSGFAHAQADDDFCNNPMSQYEMSMCAGAKADNADKDLNEAYKAVVKSLAGDQNSISALKKAERAWLTFRDAQCELENVDSVGGSIHGMEVSGCFQTKAEARTVELKSMISSSNNR